MVSPETKPLKHILFRTQGIAHEDLHIDRVAKGRLDARLVLGQEYMGERPFRKGRIDLQDRGLRECRLRGQRDRGETEKRSKKPAPCMTKNF